MYCYARHVTAVGKWLLPLDKLQEMGDPLPEFQADKNRVTGLFGFDKNVTIVFHVLKGMSVILPSTMHHSNSVDSDSRKPDIIFFYNKTKGP